jgi:hypothetical protein
MDPTDAGDRPPPPERPPPRPAWPPASWPGQPAGSAPPGQQGWGPAPPPGPPAWGPPPGPPGWGQPGWGTPPAPPPRRRVGWVLAAVAGLLVVALVATVLALRPGQRAGTSSPRALGQRPSTSLPPDPDTEIERLLARRAGAVVKGDRAAFLATVDKRQTAWYRQQATLFAAMRTVPFSAFAYRLGATRPSGLLRKRYHADKAYLGQVQARYRFQHQDASPVLARYTYAFVHTGGGWRIAGKGGTARPRDDVEIWDGGPVRTVRSTRTLVVYHAGQEDLARRLLGVADRAYTQVGAAWTGRWERKAVILVPRDQHEAERLVGARDLSEVAAVASSSVDSDAADRVLGNRIVVNTTNVARYGSLDLQVLVTHEMTHVATRTLGDDVPLLLVEGFADYAALKPVPYGFSVTRHNLWERVRSGRFDGHLPDDGQFRGSDAPVAYDEGSAFCLWVADTYGVAKLRALYRELAGSGPASAGDLDDGLRQVLGVSRRAVERRWAAWVRVQR